MAIFRRRSVQKFAFIVLMVTMLLLVGWQAGKVRFNNDRWLKKDHPVQQAQDYLASEFEGGQDLLLVFDLPPGAFFQQPLLDELESLTEWLEALPDVQEVNTPLEATTILNANNELRIESYSKALEKGHLKDLAAYRTDLEKSVYYGRLISSDFRTLNVVVNITKQPEEGNYQFARVRVLTALQAVIEDYSLLGKPRMAGEAWLYYALDVGSRSNLIRFLPMLMLVIVLLLWYLFRSVARTLIVMTSATLVFLFACAIVFWQGHDLTTVSISLPVLIWVIAIADSIHIVSRWDEEARHHPQADTVLKNTIALTWRPCFMTSLTTAVGFAAFSISNILPLRHLGQDAFLAIFVSYLVIVGTNWFGLYLFCPPQASQDRRLKIVNTLPLADFCFRKATTATRRIVFFWGIAGMASLIALGWIRFETNLLDVFFKKDSPTYKNFLHVDEHLGGSGSMDLIFQTSDEDHFKQPQVLQTMHQLEKVLVEDPQINHAISYRESVQLMFRRLKEDDNTKAETIGLPSTPEELGQTLLFLEFSRGAQSNDVLSPYVDFVYANARTHLQTPNLNSSQTKALFQRINQRLQQFSLPPVIWAGSSFLFHSLSRQVLTTQIFTVLLTVGFIYLMFLYSFGLRLGSVGLIVNVLPVLMTAGLISLSGTSFDFATVLITSVSFGLCVDDTIHSLHYFQHFKDPSHAANNLHQTLRQLAKPLVFTSILFCAGFAVFLFSDFIILIKFGFFSIFAILMALLANMLFLPACLKWLYANQFAQ